MTHCSPAPAATADTGYLPAPEDLEGELTLPAPWSLDCGHELLAARIRWRLAGHPAGPTLAVMGGISANRHVQPLGESRPGWWPAAAGAGRALDPATCRLLSFDFLGGGDSTRPHRIDEYAVTPRDQARVLAALLDELSIRQLDAVIGASYGGMVALALCQDWPDRVERALVMAAAHRASPTTSAYRAIQRDIVRQGAAAGDAQQAVALARRLAMLGFRSRDELDARFPGPGRVDAQRLRLPIEDYLDDRGRDYAAHTSAASFICLSQSCDLQAVEPGRLRTPLWLVAFDPDHVVPAADVAHLAAAAPGVERCFDVQTCCGHDGFLTETTAVDRILRAFVAEVQR